MSRTLSLSLVCQAALLVACEQPAAIPPVRDDLPHAELTSEHISFGDLTWGDSATRQLLLENTGELPMGLGSIALLEDGMEDSFSLNWVPANIVCPTDTTEEGSTARVVQQRRGPRVDTWDTGGGGSGGGSGGGTGGGGSSGGGTGGGSSDTGGGSSGGGSSGGGSGGGGSADGGGDGGATEDNTVVLDPGCKLPITVGFSPQAEGNAFGSFLVETITQTVEEGAVPAYYRDPDEFKKVVLLDGSTSIGEGNILVRSSQLDMGHLYTGESAVQYVYVNNVGDGDLTIAKPTLLAASDSDADGIDDAADVNNFAAPVDADADGIEDSCDASETGGVDADGDRIDDACRADCADSITINLASYDSDLVLGPNSSTLFEVWFNPTDINPAFCTITVPSEDPDSPAIRVKVQGNAGTDPLNENPVVEVLSPPVGYVHTATTDVIMELKIHDANQPANTLFCKVRSLLGETKVADCKPTDESGHVFVHIPTDLLESGTDTLLVTVTDQSERLGKASTTILWRSLYPDSDDDGDGWGEDPNGAYVDCDDRDTSVYPSAAELPDGKDNDCDGSVDEGTIRGDDDGDSVNEQNGDCDDTDDSTYPRAMEQADGKDNDCDGLIDEGTGVIDDDGDGFTELDLDCNDDDPKVNPSATELCDGFDNNCNGYADNADPNGCEKIAFEPMIYGGVRMTKSAIGVGESTTMTVSVYDADEQPISFAWSEDPSLAALGHTAIDNATAQTITWTAPAELPEGSLGEVFSVQVLIQDTDGNQDWAFEEVWVYPEPVTQVRESIVVLPPAQGCGSSSTTSTTSTGAGLLPAAPLLGLLALGRRRRSSR